MRISLLKKKGWTWVELLKGLTDLAVQKSDFLGQSSKGSFEVRLSFFSSSYGPDSKLCHGKFMAKVWADDHKNCLLVAVLLAAPPLPLHFGWCPFCPPAMLQSFPWIANYGFAVHAIIKWSKWVQSCVNTPERTLKCEKNGNQIK